MENKLYEFALENGMTTEEFLREAYNVALAIGQMELDRQGIKELPLELYQNAEGEDIYYALVIKEMNKEELTAQGYLVTEND